ncbi:Serine/threonine-protein kinase PrkC [Tritonibacter multivorans]|uniref:Serine/threonine-protein kinase PrkC n=1 Tax=Tritonibacter multivorans TaxID=928856 RepID=A0A0P1GHE2_9RHOB|nr:serine/threonine-protein kinase [Tritonibacter multivorans]MDA7423020.1 protein kinase [Tritonibacter multivorans]CUH75061.1 Serine/threonine-protein kinase PrkC [Tritonibacter multivorans]SFD77473.1 serine/threonine protein kinase [Tritonibacter multivorans]
MSEKTASPPSGPDEEGERTILAPMPSDHSAAPIADDEQLDERTVIAPLPNADPSAALAGTPVGHFAGSNPDAPAVAFTPGQLAQPAVSQAPAAARLSGVATDSPPDEVAEDRTIMAPMPMAEPSGHVPAGTPVQAAPPVPSDATPNTAVPVQAALSSEPLQKLETGYVINNMYRVLQPLDQGGMGRVFRGEEIGTGEPVAIKVILPEFSEDTKAADMFRREARTLRLLHHDAIVRYFAYLPPDARLNLHALIMGFIEGTKLSDRIKTKGALSLGEICRLFARLADGLAAAHEVGVVHRDLSPDNVMLPDDKIEKAVLIDFGISRSSAIKDVTLGNEFAGKLKYVSPEQLGAFGGEADGRSDIYSMGLLMYAAATGGPAPMGSSIVEAVKLREGMPDLSAAPVELQGLMYQMLQPDPAMRLATMAQVKQVLQDIEGGRSPSATTLGGTSMPSGAGLTYGVTQSSTIHRQVEGLQAAPNMGIVTSSGMQATPASSGDNGAAARPAKKGWGKAIPLLLVLSALTGGGVWYGLIQPKGGTSVVAESAQDLQRIPGRETFLAEAVPAGCAFATNRLYGPNAGMIEGFHTADMSLGGLEGAWAANYGGAPALISRVVEAGQCDVLALARRFQGTAGAKTELTLSTNVMTRRDEISGKLWGSVGRADWLAIITPKGQVYNLTSRLQDPIGQERQFSFRIRSGAPGKYMLVAISSHKSLVRTGAMQDGTDASAIFHLISRELEKAPGAAVDVGFVHIMP